MEAIECLHWWLKDETLILTAMKFNDEEAASVDVEDLYGTGVVDEESSIM